MEMQCQQAPNVFGLRVNTTGEDFVGHLKKAAAAAAAFDDVLSRRVHTKSNKHLVSAGTASPRLVHDFVPAGH